MPAINFSERFAGAVETGQKRTTIRKVRKRRPIVAGDRLILYTGQRTKHARKLREECCINVRDVRITKYSLQLNDSMKTFAEAEAIARDDGFQSLAEFVLWFDDLYGLPFEGVHICW